jgi:hypothetical protein
MASQNGHTIVNNELERSSHSEEQPLLESHSDEVPEWSPPAGFILIQIGKFIAYIRECGTLKQEILTFYSNHGKRLPRWL